MQQHEAVCDAIACCLDAERCLARAVQHVREAKARLVAANQRLETEKTAA